MDRNEKIIGALLLVSMVSFAILPEVVALSGHSEVARILVSITGMSWNSAQHYASLIIEAVIAGTLTYATLMVILGFLSGGTISAVWSVISVSVRWILKTYGRLRAVQW